MIRKHITDSWKEVSWDEAINYAASEFRRIQSEYGQRRVGGTSSRHQQKKTWLALVRAGRHQQRAARATRLSAPPATA